MIDVEELRRAERHLGRADPVMGRIVHEIGPCGLDELQRPASFESLVRSIVFQQLSGKAAATIYSRLTDLLGVRRPTPGSILAVSEEDLRGVGLSRQKAAYVRDLAARVEAGELSLRRLRRLDDDEVVAELTRVKGIGPWTAQMFLIFHLGRLDVFPVGDLAVRESTRAAYGLDETATRGDLEEIAEAWRPYRSVASWYLWRLRHAELPAGDPA